MTAQTKPISVVVIDDHPLVIAGVRSLIEAEPDLECVGVATTGAAGLKLVEETDPDVIVLDVSLPDTNGLMIAKQIAESGRRGHIVMMTLLEGRTYIEQAIQAGAKGIVQKRSGEQHLLLAIRTAMLGGLYLDPATARDMSAPEMDECRVDPAPKDLTNRESEVLRMVAFGFSNKEVAHKVSVSVKSVETYKARAKEKLKLYSRAQIVNFALNSGWFNRPQNNTEAIRAPATGRSLALADLLDI